MAESVSYSYFPDCISLSLSFSYMLSADYLPVYLGQDLLLNHFSNEHHTQIHIHTILWIWHTMRTELEMRFYDYDTQNTDAFVYKFYITLTRWWNNISFFLYKTKYFSTLNIVTNLNFKIILFFFLLNWTLLNLNWRFHENLILKYCDESIRFNE